MVGGRRRAETHRQRHRLAAGSDGLHAPPQHRRRTRALLGRHTGQRSRFPRRGVLPDLSGTGRMSVQRGDELPFVAFAVRHQDGRPPERHPAAFGSLGPPAQAGYHLGPEQDHHRPKRYGEKFLHEPPRAAILRAGSAYPDRRHGQLLRGAVQPDPAEDPRTRRHLLLLHRTGADGLQSLLRRGRRVRHRETRGDQDAAADAVEAGVGGADTRRGSGPLERRESLPRQAPHRRLARTLVRYLLRVRRNGLPRTAAAEAREGEGFRSGELSQRTGTVLQGGRIRLSA